MSLFDKIVAVLAFLGIGALGIAALVSLKEGASPEWVRTGIALIVLSVAMGTLGAKWAHRGTGVASFFRAGCLHALGTLVVVAIFMGGGPTLWTIGFWIVSAVGWVSAFCWAFFFVLTLIHMFQPSSTSSTQVDKQ